MAEYFVTGDLSGRIPTKFLIQALDDDKDGAADPAVISAMQADVQSDIDGRLGQRYETPFTNPLPAVVRSAAISIACEMVYKRRGVEGKNNPYSEEAAKARAKLDRIGNGKEPLEPNKKDARPPAVFTSGDAKTVPSNGKTLA